MSSVVNEAFELLLEIMGSGEDFHMSGCPLPLVMPEFVVSGCRGVPGSGVTACTRCGARVFIIDSYELLARFPSVPLLCVTCALKHVRANKACHTGGTHA
jgi:hypothetical protein